MLGQNEAHNSCLQWFTHFGTIAFDVVHGWTFDAFHLKGSLIPHPASLHCASREAPSSPPPKAGKT